MAENNERDSDSVFGSASGDGAVYFERGATPVIYVPEPTVAPSEPSGASDVADSSSE